MSKRNEDRDVFFIPPNFLTSGRLFGGSIRFRNAIEASILVLITAFPIIKLPLDLTPKIMLLCHCLWASSVCLALKASRCLSSF